MMVSSIIVELWKGSGGSLVRSVSSLSSIASSIAADNQLTLLEYWCSVYLTPQGAYWFRFFRWNLF